MKQIINTAAIDQAGRDMARANQELRAAFSTLSNQVGSFGSWSGRGCTAAERNFRRIADAFPEQQYSIFNDMACFLQDYVDTSYETVERRIVSAADAFK